MTDQTFDRLFVHAGTTGKYGRSTGADRWAGVDRRCANAGAAALAGDAVVSRVLAKALRAIVKDGVASWRRAYVDYCDCCVISDSQVPLPENNPKTRFYPTKASTSSHEFGMKWNKTASWGAGKYLKQWWPGTESNRRRQPFQGCRINHLQISFSRFHRVTGV